MEQLTHSHAVEIHWHSYELRPKGAPPISPEYLARIQEGRPRLYATARENYGLELKPGPFGIDTRPALIGAKYAEAQNLGAAYHDRIMQAYGAFRQEYRAFSDAEVVRDLALSAAGLLSNRLGGPSVIPPVPQNVLDYNYTYPRYWTPASGPERYRRSVYGFRKRSMPDPVMSNFDGPNGDASCARRLRSNTPLAALTGLNEPIFVEAARALALRVLREGGTTDAERADYAFQLCTSRCPTADEREEMLKLLQSRRQLLADGWLNPRLLISGDPSNLPKLPEKTTPQDAAAWTIMSRVLLNLDETITKN